MGKGILNRGTQVHKSKVKYNRLTIAKKFNCEDEVKGNEIVEKHIQKEYSHMSQKQKSQWRSYVLAKLEEEKKGTI